MKFKLKKGSNWEEKEFHLSHLEFEVLNCHTWWKIPTSQQHIQTQTFYTVVENEMWMNILGEATWP